jgi:hypothetical protein
MTSSQDAARKLADVQKLTEGKCPHVEMNDITGRMKVRPRAGSCDQCVSEAFDRVASQAAEAERLKTVKVAGMKLTELAEKLTSIAYDHAVTMHESILHARGAVGWRDEELLAKVMGNLMAHTAMAILSERERCAKVAEASIGASRREIAAAIRALPPEGER